MPTFWNIVWIHEPAWHDRDDVMSVAGQIASRGTVAEWNKFVNLARIYGYLNDRPTPEEFLRRQGQR